MLVGEYSVSVPNHVPIQQYGTECYIHSYKLVSFVTEVGTTEPLMQSVCACVLCHVYFDLCTKLRHNCSSKLCSIIIKSLAPFVLI